ncbi:MAG: VWA domain-containing protein [Myxococcota bacterium]
MKRDEAGVATSDPGFRREETLMLTTAHVLRPMPALAAALALSAAGCTDTPLTVSQNIEVEQVDNLLRIKGELCTDPPEATDFPVKILFMIDGSGSMQFVDPNNLRARAVEEAIIRLRANPSVEFAVIRFNESDAVLTRPGTDISATDPFGVDLSGAFTRDVDTLTAAVNGLNVADSVTDYQGALSSAFLLLSQDMLDSPPAELARTRYVLLFLSDGDPFPTCCSQESQAAGICEADTNIFFCEDPDAIRQNPTQLPFLEASQDYNQPYQIFDVVQDIMELAENFGVGDLRLSTGFLFDQSLVDDLNADGCFVIAGVNFVCADEARSLLGTMAEIGQGVFRDFSNAEEIDFLGFDLTSIKREQALKNLIVTNTNYMATSTGLRIDTDGDGIDDETEIVEGLDDQSRDTDGDGFSDRIERSRSRNGLDPLVPTPGCEDPDLRRDVDADGLNVCEEQLLRTSTDLFDTDADGIPDGLEVSVGSQPRVSDIGNPLPDADLDERSNADEVRFHTSLFFDEGNAAPGLSYRYRTDEIEPNPQGGRCYEFDVRNVQLGTPAARPGEADSFARNDILVYLAQAPRDDPTDFGTFKVACIQGRYVPPDFKDPLAGEVVLCPEDFIEPDLFSPVDGCLGLASGPDITPAGLFARYREALQDELIEELDIPPPDLISPSELCELRRALDGI